jgi:AcrR family transcriptional regulator
MTAARRGADPAVRRRPKDRKAQIAKASADAFSAQGYHAVSMENIAERVGITPTALYRHSPSKYDLFRDAVLALGQFLVDATAFADDSSCDSDPAETLRALIGALIDVTIDNRTAGGLYRWEGRYLHGEDRAALAEQIKLVNRRLQRPLALLRPKLTSHARWILSSAALSIVGSITDHRNPLAVADIRSGMTEVASDVLAVDLPARRRQQSDPWPPPVLPAAAGTYEVVLHQSMCLFNARGYRDTGMEDIAAAAGMAASGIYQYFRGKADILAASYRRAADRLSGDLARIATTTSDPKIALSSLIEAHVARSFASPALAYVYYTERHNVPESDARVLDSIQRSTVEAWAGLAVAARPDIGLGRARYAVHAAFALAVDPGRLLSNDPSVPARPTMRRLMEAALLGTRASG